jgi:hypothetical protein
MTNQRYLVSRSIERGIFPKYRIVYVDRGDFNPCHWQIQQRTFLFFWKNLYNPFSSATTCAHEIMKLMGVFFKVQS